MRALGWACFLSITVPVVSTNSVKKETQARTSARVCQINPTSAYVLADSLGMGLKYTGLEVTLRALLRGPQPIIFDGEHSITTPDTHIQKSALESVDTDTLLISDAKFIS